MRRNPGPRLRLRLGLATRTGAATRIRATLGPGLGLGPWIGFSEQGEGWAESRPTSSPGMQSTDFLPMAALKDAVVGRLDRDSAADLL